MEKKYKLKNRLFSFVGESRRLRSICEELLGSCHKYAKDPGSILVNIK